MGSTMAVYILGWSLLEGNAGRSVKFTDPVKVWLSDYQIIISWNLKIFPVLKEINEHNSHALENN